MGAACCRSGQAGTNTGARPAVSPSGIPTDEPEPFVDAWTLGKRASFSVCARSPDGIRGFGSISGRKR